jgi:hypothetical protein
VNAQTQVDIAPISLIGAGGGAFGAVAVGGTTVAGALENDGNMNNGAGSIWLYRQHPVSLPGNSTFSILLRFGGAAAAVGATYGLGIKVALFGFYPLHPDDHCNSVSVDFDNHRGTRQTERDPREDFDAVAMVLQRRGVRFLGHHSRGGRGYWIHLLPPAGTSARVARAVLQRLLDEAGAKHIDAGGTVDCLFPKQDSLHVGPSGDSTAAPGNLFCLPLSRRWLSSDPPGSHFIGHDPSDLRAQLATLRSYL